MAIVTKIEKITPGQATELLTSSAGNRTMRYGHVAGIAATMRRGAWVLNGESIVIDAAGRLVDGHHRLMALRVANLTVAMQVTRGVDPSVMKTINTGISRALGDRLTIAGIPDGKFRAAMFGALLRVITGISSGGVAAGRAYELGEPVLGAGVDSYMRETSGKRWLRRGNVAGPLIAAFCRFDGMPEFYRALRDGSDLPSGSAIHTLREYLTSPNFSRRGVSPDMRSGMILGAVEAHFGARPISRLSANPGALQRTRDVYNQGEVAGIVAEIRSATNESRQLVRGRRKLPIAQP